MIFILLSYLLLKMVLNYQIQHKIDNKDKKINNTIKVNNILTVLKTRINHSKTLSENLIFILNRTSNALNPL